MLMMKMNNHALCRKAMPCSGQNRNVGLKMLKLYINIMLKIHNQNEGTLLCSENTNVIPYSNAVMSFPNAVRHVQVAMAGAADLHDDVTYEGWGKSSAAGHRECMGNSKRVLRRSVSLLLGKTDGLHALIFATQRVGVFISESDG